MNPMEIIQMIKQGQNPQQLIMQILEQNMSQTPMGQNLINMAKNGQSQEIEQFARNYLSQNGKDFDKEFAEFRKQLGL